MIDARIDKPRVQLQDGSLVATTGALLRSSGLAHERLVQTGVRTPLGEVVLARLDEPGTVEVAGPSAAADLRAVSEAMLELGAEQVLIDGAIDRRAASSPDVADGLVMATGAILERRHRSGGRRDARRGRPGAAAARCRRSRRPAPRDAGEAARRGRTRGAGAPAGAERRAGADRGAAARARARGHVRGGGRAERALPGGPAGGAQRARRARAADRGGRPDEGLSVAPRAALVRASGRVDRGAADDRAEGDHGQPGGAAVASLRLAHAARADRVGRRGRAGRWTCSTSPTWRWRSSRR